MSTQTFNLSLPEGLVKKIDKAAKLNYASRSEYIKRVLLNQTQAEERLAELFDRSNAKGKRLGMTSEQQVYDELKK